MNKPFEINGIEFGDIQSAMDYFGASRYAVFQWKKHGHYKTRGGEFELDGVVFKGNKEAMAYFGVGSDTIKRWKKTGVVNKNIKRPTKTVLFGREFNSLKEAQEFYGKSKSTIVKWKSDLNKINKSNEKDI